MIVVREGVDVEDHGGFIEFEAMVLGPKVAAFVDDHGYDPVHLVALFPQGKLEPIAFCQLSGCRRFTHAAGQKYPIDRIQSMFAAIGF
jgi:hypothetical protein